MDAVAAHAVVSGTRDWPATVRAVAAYAATCVIAWHSPDVAKYALCVVAVVSSPAFARAVLAPRLASMLNAATPSGSHPAVRPPE